MYLLECAEVKMAHMSEDQRKKLDGEPKKRMDAAIALTIYRGLRGDAKLFVSDFDEDDLLNRTVMEERLRARFPFRKRVVDDMADLNTRITSLDQGHKKLEEYIDEALRIKALIPQGEVTTTTATNGSQTDG